MWWGNIKLFFVQKAGKRPQWASVSLIAVSIALAGFWTWVIVKILPWIINASIFILILIVVMWAFTKLIETGDGDGS